MGVFYVKTRRAVDPANQVDTLPDHHKRPEGNCMHWVGIFSGARRHSSCVQARIPPVHSDRSGVTRRAPRRDRA